MTTPQHIAATALKATPDVILTDRTCIGCGYSLRGLRLSGTCPECGRAIQSKRRAIRYTDQLVHAPTGWLEVFATGAVLLFIAAVAIVAMTITLLFVHNLAILVIALGISVAWTLGVWLTTRVRPVMPTTTENVEAEWRTLRLAARATQCFWPLTCLLTLFCVWVYNSSTSGAALNAAIGCTVLSLIIAIAGVAPTCALLAHIADWAEDSSLAQGLRGCAWTVCFCGLVIALAVLNTFTGLLGGVIGGVLAVCLIAMVFMPPAYFLVCLYRLQSMARWAIWNHVAAEAKLDRFRARAGTGRPKSGNAHSPRHTPPPAR